MYILKSYKKYVTEYLYLLGENQRRYPFLLFLFIVSSVFDMLGIGLIGPFIKLATDPSIVENYGILGSIKSLFGLAEHNRFVIYVGFVIAIVFYLKSIIGYYIQKMIMNFSFCNKAHLINRLMSTYQKLDYSFHVKRNSASLIQRLLENTNTYTEMTLISSLRFISEFFVIVCIFALLAFSNIAVTLTMLVLLSALIVVYYKIVKKHFYRAGAQLLTSSEDILKWFNQAIYGFKEIRILGAESYFYDKVSASGLMYANAASQAQALQSIPRYLAECAFLTIVVGMVIVTLLLGKSVVDLMPVLGMFAIASFRLIPSVNKSATSFTNMRYSRQAMRDLYDDLSLIDNFVSKDSNHVISAAHDTKNKLIPFHQINIENMSFQYPETNQLVLNNINLNIKRGECIGLVGKSGSGKTTLIDILLGLHNPTSGYIKVDGEDTLENLNRWRQIIAYIPQNFFLLDDTLKNNITLEADKCHVNDQKLLSAIKAASLSDVIAQLPNGIDSIIGEHGVKLSGGQRQRIALARAFYHDRELIIMDEATSSLDADTEKQIVETIAEMKVLKTLIVIAHRKSTLAPCDKIYKLEQGCLTLMSDYPDTEIAMTAEVQHAGI